MAATAPSEPTPQRLAAEKVRIRAVRSIPLYGMAPDAGWFDRVDRSQNLPPSP